MLPLGRIRFDVIEDVVLQDKKGSIDPHIDLLGFLSERSDPITIKLDLAEPRRGMNGRYGRQTSMRPMETK